MQMELSKGELRRQKILDMLKLQGKISIQDILDALNCSEATARRDLDLLEKSGRLIRTIGGAVSDAGLAATGLEIPFAEKRALNWKEKEAIAALAAGMVEEGDVVCLTGGTTTYLIAKQLKRSQHITVVTNAVNIAMELADADGIQVVVSGGVMRSKSFELCGPLAEKVIESINITKMFMGVDGVTPEHGFTTYSELEARIARMFIQRSSRVFAVFDHSKWGKSSLFTIVPLEEVDGVIVDREFEAGFMRACEDKGCHVWIPRQLT
jgi:DeoR/GlpR family transcriptional regulator of sugar metabolism